MIHASYSLSSSSSESNTNTTKSLASAQLADNTKELVNTIKSQKTNRKLSSLLGTLRGHNFPISIIEILYLPSTISFNETSTTENKNLKSESSGDHHQLMTPTVITADESGCLIWWDIYTKRPFGSWKAHDGNILTLKQLGLSWKASKSSVGKLPEIDREWYGKLLSHGKDGEIKIWDIFQIVELNSTSITYKNSCPLQRKIFSQGEKLSKWPSPKILFQMPVNTMNFTNVDIQSSGLVVTPSTQDSNRFDIYKISINEKDIENSGGLKRLLKAVCPLEIIKQDNLGLTIDHIKDEEVGPSKDLGIVMRIAWLSKNEFSVGYESGHVITFELETNSNKIRIINLNSKHFPNPIMAMVFDAVNKKLISTSSSDTIVIDDMNYGKSQIDVTDNVSVFKIKHKGIADIKARSDLIGLVTWDGFSRFYKYDNEQVLKFQFKLKKLAPSTTASSTSLATNENDITGSIDELMCQGASVIAFTKVQKNYAVLKTTNNLIHNNGISKNIIRKRDELNYDRNWVFIAYKDGRINLYNTIDDQN